MLLDDAPGIGQAQAEREFQHPLGFSRMNCAQRGRGPPGGSAEPEIDNAAGAEQALDAVFQHEPRGLPRMHRNENLALLLAGPGQQLRVADGKPAGHLGDFKRLDAAPSEYGRIDGPPAQFERIAVFVSEALGIGLRELFAAHRRRVHGVAEAQRAFGFDEIRIAFGEWPRRSTCRSRLSDRGDAGQAAAQEGQPAFRCRPAGNVGIRQDQRQKTEKVDLGRLAIGPLATISRRQSGIAKSW